MLSTLKESLEKIKKSEEFGKWKKRHPKSYFCSAFLDKIWQLDFYDPSTDRISSFRSNETIEIQEEEKIFRKEKKEIKKLNLDEIKIDLDFATKIIKRII
jgi:hypothetical protein